MNIIKTYNDTAELMAEIDGRDPESHAYAARRDPEFCPASGPEAVAQLAGKAPYKSPVIQLSQKMLDEIMAADFGENKNSLSVEFDVAGNEADIDRYLCGEPENMRTFTPSLEKREINVIILPGGTGDIDAETFVNRGAAALAVVDALAASGRYNVKIKIILGCELKYNYYAWVYNMDLSKVWSRGLLEFMIVSPAFLRRIGFILRENIVKESSLGGEGYGVSQTLSKLTQIFSREKATREAWEEALGPAEARIIFDKLSENISADEAKAEAERIIKQYISEVK